MSLSDSPTVRPTISLGAQAVKVSGAGGRIVVAVGESEKDTRPPLVRTRRPATTPRLAGRTLWAVVTTIRVGWVNDRGKGVILDQLIMQILIL